MNITSETSYLTRKDCISTVINNKQTNSHKCNLVCDDSKCLWRMKFVKRAVPHSAFYPDLS